MLLLEWIVPLLIGAVALTMLAERLAVPYPAFLALGGMALALLPRGPNIVLEPDLALALFVAPVIVDTAYDASLRDLRSNWLSISLLVVACVGVTTAAVAVAAPRDAARSAVVGSDRARRHRRAARCHCGDGDFAPGAPAVPPVDDPGRRKPAQTTPARCSSIARPGSFAVGGITPAFLATSFAAGAAGEPRRRLARRAGHDAGHGPRRRPRAGDHPAFTFTFGIWMLAEKLQLSAVLVLVAYAATISNRGASRLGARMRLPVFSVWEVAIFVLNVLAFVLIGLQLRPILEGMSAGTLAFSLAFAFAILLVCVLAPAGLGPVLWADQDPPVRSARPAARGRAEPCRFPEGWHGDRLVRHAWDRHGSPPPSRCRSAATAHRPFRIAT